jgi:hypothetical protein
MAKKEDDLSPSHGERGRGDDTPSGSSVEDIRGIASDEDDDFDDDDDDLDDMEDDESEDV